MIDTISMSDNKQNQEHIQIPYSTPRWLLQMLPWVNAKNDVYRIKQVKHLYEEPKIIIPTDKKIGNPDDYYFLSDLLKCLPLFEHIPDELMQELLKGIYKKITKVGEVIIKQGEIGKEFYIITEGQFKAIIDEEDGNKKVIKTLAEGDYFGEMALLEATPRQATITATTKGSVLVLKKESFDNAISNQNLRDELLKVVRIRKNELESLQNKHEDLALITAQNSEGIVVPNVSIKYTEQKEITLNCIKTIVGVNADDMDTRLEQKLRVAIENIEEKEEWEIINNRDFGLLANVDQSMVIDAKSELPTPDMFDAMLGMVWKKPTCFLAHPKTIAAFEKECNHNNLQLEAISVLGQKFLSWRGIALIPSDKLKISPNGFSNVLLMRIGEDSQGVIGLYKENISSDYKPKAPLPPSLAIQSTGINDRSITGFLVTKYFSVAVLVPDSLAVLKNVKVG